MKTRSLVAADVLVILLVVVVFTLLQVNYSLSYGRLAIPPTYDDIGYLRDGYVLLSAAYDRGWWGWLRYAATTVWHAPLAAVQASVGFALTARSTWSPYALNGVYLFALLLIMRKELAATGLRFFCALTFALLSWPIAAFTITEFRPDVVTGLFAALGGWRIAKLAVSGTGASWSWMPVWSLTWPFLLALWLKPSYAPVTLGYWIATWCLAVLASGAARHEVLRIFAGGLAVLALGFMPYAWVSGGHLAAYWQATVFGSGQEVWVTPMSLPERMAYYLHGSGGRAMMGRWLAIAIVTVAVAAYLARRRGWSLQVKLGALYLAFAFTAWAGLTILSNKSQWFGALVTAHVVVLFVAAMAVIHAFLAEARWSRRVLAAGLVLAGILLQRWPVDGALPDLPREDLVAFAAESQRVNSDICAAIGRYGNLGTSTVLVPVVSLGMNPDLVQLCDLQVGRTAMQAPLIYSAPFDVVMAALRDFDRSGEGNVLALILSEDYPGIPGNLSSSKQAGSVNHFFDKSSTFRLVAGIPGPRGSGLIRLFLKTPQGGDPNGLQGPDPGGSAVGREQAEMLRSGSSFRNVDFLSGFGSIEGPFRQWKLPVVRWGIGAESRFSVAGAAAGRGTLLMEWRPADGISALEVRSNEISVGRCQVESTGGEFSRCEIRLPPGDDSREFVVRYVREAMVAVPSQQNSALFKRIEIRPEAT